MKKVPDWFITPFRVFYTYAFNIYAWYWAYKLMFKMDSSWEEWTTWAFACTGMWFFVLDSGDLKFKKTLNDTIGYPDLLGKDKN
jgi:hypothetical protein